MSMLSTAVFKKSDDGKKDVLVFGLDPKTFQTVNTLPSMTKVSLTDEWDINKIAERYNVTGQLPITNRIGQYADVSSLPNLQEALNQVRDAKYLYDQLPSKVREETGFDPTRLEGWLKDPRNKDLAVSLKLLEPTKAPDAPVLPPSGPSIASKGGKPSKGAAPVVPDDPGAS